MNGSRPDDELIASITPNVLGVLTRCGFFEELDNRFCPIESSAKRERCAGNHQVSESILRSKAFDETAVGEVIAVLQSQGGCCDCEVLYNVAETSRLKAEYWNSRAKELRPHGDSK